jgi:hypothetical protein
MKSLLFTLVISLCFLSTKAQTKNEPDPNKKLQTVEASCGQCKFGLKGKGCNLAVRIEDKAYFVDGTEIDSHGDAHESDGFCNAIRKAEVQGEVVNGRFQVSYFKLLPVEKKVPAKKG